MRLCASEWCALEKICSEEKIVRNRLIEMIESNNQTQLGLTYLTRLLTMMYYYKTVTGNKSKKDSDNGYVKIMNLLNELKSHS